MRSFLRRTVGPLFLMLATPIALGVFWLTASEYDGSLMRFFTEMSASRLVEVWPRPSLAAIEIIGIFAIVEALLMQLLPGKTLLGPVTPTGNQPTYKLNGPLAFVTTLGLFVGASWGLHLFSPGVVYDHFGEILTTVTLFALCFCLFLYLKGVYFPSSSDHGRSGNFIFDFFWGVELHPHFGKFNVKQYANCRLGMMGWPVIIVSFLGKQQALYGEVSNSMWVCTAVQLVYIAKFFYWEGGYFHTLDIMHDRFGYYICWGVLCWITGVYTLTSLYLVNHPIHLHPVYAVACFALGVISIWINYDADAQRQRLRRTGGNTTIWGKKPETILAKYKTSDGVERENLLLVSGWWGVARHFHYVPEIMLSVAWALPALFHNFLPWFYVVYLSILLFDRSGRDDKRCSAKYGESWKEYCKRVPYRIIPGIY